MCMSKDCVDLVSTTEGVQLFLICSKKISTACDMLMKITETLKLYFFI